MSHTKVPPPWNAWVVGATAVSATALVLGWLTLGARPPTQLTTGALPEEHQEAPTDPAASARAPASFQAPRQPGTPGARLDTSGQQDDESVNAQSPQSLDADPTGQVVPNEVDIDPAVYRAERSLEDRRVFLSSRRSALKLVQKSIDRVQQALELARSEGNEERERLLKIRLGHMQARQAEVEDSLDETQQDPPTE